MGSVVWRFQFLFQLLPVASGVLDAEDAVQKVGSASKRVFVLLSVYTTVDVATEPH